MLSINFIYFTEEVLLYNHLKFKFPVCEAFSRWSIQHFSNFNAVTTDLYEVTIDQ